MTDASRAKVLAHLERVLGDFAVSGANRRSRLLRFLVENALDDRADSFKESVIATEVFDRPPDYDPQIDSAVRVEVGRLRARLAEYYEVPGRDAPVRIEIPRGGYRPVFVFRESPQNREEPARPELPPRGEAKSRPKWVATSALLLAAIAGIGIFVWRRGSSEPSTPPAIVVLPFLNLSGDTGDEYLADGISEELTESLAEFNDLRVVARTSAFQYKGKSLDVRQIGQDLRAGAVLEGSISKRQGQLRVIAQLIRTSDGYHLWSHTYDTDLAQLGLVESGIAAAAREHLNPAAAKPATAEAAKAATPEAHDLYMRAVYALNQATVASTGQALYLARQAADKDPKFAAPYVLMAAGESQLVQLQAQIPRESGERAWKYAVKALELDPSNSAAHGFKALLAYTNLWDWPQAESEFKLALAEGSHGAAENLYGWCLTTRGRYEEARRHLQAAAELDPLSLGPQLNQVTQLMEERNYPEGKRKIARILQSNPSHPVALGLAWSIAFWQQDCATAKASSAKVGEIYPGAAAAVLGRAGTEYLCGDREEGLKQIKNLVEHPPPYASPYALASAAAFESNPDMAVVYLEKSAEIREPRLLMLRFDPAFDSVRKDARVIALQKKIGLPD